MFSILHITDCEIDSIAKVMISNAIRIFLYHIGKYSAGEFKLASMRMRYYYVMYVHVKQKNPLLISQSEVISMLVFVCLSIYLSVCVSGFLCVMCAYTVVYTMEVRVTGTYVIDR